METGSAAAARPSLVRVVPLIVLVALCAGLVSGSCTGMADVGAGAVILATGLAAGTALAIGLLFLVITRDRREVRFFAVIGVAAYIAAEFGAWYLIVLPIAVVLLTVIVGGVIAGNVAGKAFGVPRSKRQGVAVVTSVAILMATIAVVAGFWMNLEGPVNVLGDDAFLGENGSSGFNAYRFALITGIVPPVVSAAGAWLAGDICRRAGNRL